MRKITWDQLTAVEQHVLANALHYDTIVTAWETEKLGAFSLKDYGLLRQIGGRNVWMITDAGRALVASQQPANPVAAGVARPSLALVSRSMIADYVAAGDIERVWDVIGDLQQQIASQETDLAETKARLQVAEAALKPFAAEWDQWEWYVKEGGEKNVVEIFTMGMQPEVLAGMLKTAAEALRAASK